MVAVVVMLWQIQFFMSVCPLYINEFDRSAIHRTNTNNNKDKFMKAWIAVYAASGPIHAGGEKLQFIEDKLMMLAEHGQDPVGTLLQLFPELT